MTTSKGLMLGTIGPDATNTGQFPLPLPLDPALVEDIGSRVQQFTMNLERLLMASQYVHFDIEPHGDLLTFSLSPLHVLNMDLPPSALCGLHLPSKVRDDLIATFFYFAAGKSGSRSSQSYLACGQALLEPEAQAMSAVSRLAHILMRSKALLSEIVPTWSKLSQPRSGLGTETESGLLRVWTAVLDSQEMLAQGNLEGAKLRIIQERNLTPLVSSSLSLSPSIIVQSGRYELHALEGLINYGTGDYVGSWHCFQQAFLLGNKPTEHSTAVVIGFLQILHLMSPSVFPSDLTTWQFYEQHLPKGHNHRLLLCRLTQCLIQAVYYDTQNFEARIGPVSQFLRESAPTAASGFLSDLEQLARSAVLFRKLKIHYDLQRELDEVRARCPLYVWLSPTLEAPAWVCTHS